MLLFVGLGNPTHQYEQTRHNIGFMVLDAFAKKHEFPEFKLNKKSDSLLSESIVGQQKVLLAKPRTSMNNSGDAVSILTTNYKLQTTNLLVVHDDIDLPLGKLRISMGSGSAGHKGVESIISALGTQDFVRVRLGIQPKTGKPEQVEEFVLQRFSQVESNVVEQTIQNACAALDSILRNGIEKAMSEYN
ncbi:MAG: aminoacyl-tRNA hydrolase [Patescibacteria group bacterium]